MVSITASDHRCSGFDTCSHCPCLCMLVLNDYFHMLHQATPDTESYYSNQVHWWRFRFVLGQHTQCVEGCKVLITRHKANRNQLNRMTLQPSSFSLTIKNLQIYNEERRRFSLLRNQPRKIVEKVASDIEKLLARKRKALNVSICEKCNWHQQLCYFMCSLFPFLGGAVRIGQTK